MPDFLVDRMWLEAYRVLTSGEPPIMLQMLLFNTIMTIIWSLRRARGIWTIRRETAIVIQAVLILGNVAILLNPDPEFKSLPV